MIVLFVFIFVLTLFLLGWFFYKDRNYSKKDLKEVISDEMRQELNLPNHFNTYEPKEKPETQH